MIKFLCFWRKREREPVEASPEAKAALAQARQLRAKSDKVFSDRAELLEANHFAARIDRLYKGIC